MELTSDEAMKQSLRLVRDVSLSMSWNAESFPAEGDGKKEGEEGGGSMPGRLRDLQQRWEIIITNSHWEKLLQRVITTGRRVFCSRSSKLTFCCPRWDNCAR